MSPDFTAASIPYSDTGFTSKIINAYLSGDKSLDPFFEYAATVDGVKRAISSRKNIQTNRGLLVGELRKCYSVLDHCERVSVNIELLLRDNTFTVCTAHQPNLFTGHLYFIYKILHTVKLAEYLKAHLPEYNFVPVFFMGSEDADLEELNHVFIDGKKYAWQTQQKGAVGRMKVDKGLIQVLNEIAGRLTPEPYGHKLLEKLILHYTEGRTIEDATTRFVHDLFKDFGLVIFLPDNTLYKAQMKEIFREDILENSASKIVEETSIALSKHFKLQAQPREINLFYLSDGIRNRIIAKDDKFYVNDLERVFSKNEILEELENHPERFSPNVILRGLMQEKLLPNLVFIGGGGELAYWLELKSLFKHFNVPYPVLVLRNSFLIIESRYKGLLEKLGLDPRSVFTDQSQLLQMITQRDSKNDLSLQTELKEFLSVYKTISEKVDSIDPTLKIHLQALEKKHLNNLEILEKKMLKAEKRKFADQAGQLEKLYEGLFPGGALQERSEGFLLYYAKWGTEFFQKIFDYSRTLDPAFEILVED